MMDVKKTPKTWIRVDIADTARLKAIKRKMGLDFVRAVQDNLAHMEVFRIFPLTFLSLSQGRIMASRVIFALEPHQLVSLEPDGVITPLSAAQERLKRHAQDVDAITCFFVILQAISDSTDTLLVYLNENLGTVLVQTNAVLNSLEVRDRDFGVSDVVSAQIALGEVEELLSDCIESQLQLAQAARHVLAYLPPLQSGAKQRFLALIEDIEAIETHVSFVHDRVRLLQTTSNMALNVKQNQIIKVFSVVTAVFLPAMLISTFYSMNIVNMPALSLPFGEPLIIFLTALFSLLPLLYVKHRGWLR